MKTKTSKVQILLEALPFIKEFSEQIVVIKYGGSAQTSPELKEKFAQDILLMYLVGLRPVVVHGGGPRITDMLGKLDIPTEFVDGQRITTPEVMRIVEMVLCGEINNEIVSLLNSHGAKAIGLNGKDAHFIRAEPKEHAKWGLTGTITKVNADVIHKMIREKFIPVIAPIASGEEMGHPGYNINADLAAAKIAEAIGANKVIFMTDTAGVLDKRMELLASLTEEEVEALKADGTIHGGMVPKVDACLDAIDGGVKKAHIIDGRIEHAMLLELFTAEGVGTEITL
ncbi:acetylglutamate kinase [Sulfurimonas sp. HSL3-7]|uniref:acetylglutamate kinase n=1 Tax=Sulfonitrofixus jiaomeiensis TaxID=3131938 RepID=UPI0031F76AD6